MLQVLIGVVFGYFTTFCNYLVSFLPTPENLGIRIVMVLASTVFVALGIFLYLPANLIPLAGEGCMQAVSSTGHLAVSEEETSSNYVITISREFGSGGREIGKLLAERFGFAKESALIHELSQRGSCIIVGRLANYILKDMPTAYHVFISADLDAEAARVSARDNISPQSAAAKVKKVNHERAIHCRHFTKTDWGNVKNYDLCIKSDDFGVAETAQIIGDLFQKKMGL